MDPSGHDLHKIPMFLDTMWRGGGPYHGGSAKISPGNYNGDWQGAGKEMMHFAFDRHAGGTQGVFMDHSVQHIPIKKLWAEILALLRGSNISKNANNRFIYF